MGMDSAVATIAQAGKYLSFVLGEDEYGLEILKIQEINGMMGITPVSGASDCVCGEINLRGRVTPVISLRRKFGLPPVDGDERTCIIVVQVAQEDAESTMGLVVDEVSEVLNITEEQIAPPTSFGCGPLADGFANGTATLEGKVVTLLDIDRILGGAELAMAVRSPN